MEYYEESQILEQVSIILQRELRERSQNDDGTKENNFKVVKNKDTRVVATN